MLCKVPKSNISEFHKRIPVIIFLYSWESILTRKFIILNSFTSLIMIASVEWSWQFFNVTIHANSWSNVTNGILYARKFLIFRKIISQTYDLNMFFLCKFERMFEREFVMTMYSWVNSLSLGMKNMEQKLFEWNYMYVWYAYNAQSGHPKLRICIMHDQWSSEWKSSSLAWQVLWPIEAYMWLERSRSWKVFSF